MNNKFNKVQFLLHQNGIKHNRVKYLNNFHKFNHLGKII